MNINLRKEPLGQDRQGRPVYLKDLWPGNREIRETIAQYLSPQMFREKYADVFMGEERWQRVAAGGGATYHWREGSTYVQRPSYFEGMSAQPRPLKDILVARPCGHPGGFRDHRPYLPRGGDRQRLPGRPLPAGAGSGGRRLQLLRLPTGQHLVMMRGTFANIRLRNQMAPGTEGGVTKKWPEGKETTIFDTAMEYQKQGTPLVVVAGSEYGTGSSRRLGGQGGQTARWWPYSPRVLSASTAPT